MPFPPPGDLPNPGIEPRSPSLEIGGNGGFFTIQATREVLCSHSKLDVSMDDSFGPEPATPAPCLPVGTISARLHWDENMCAALKIMWQVNQADLELKG